MPPDPIPRSWLQRSGSAEEFERAELERKAKAFHLPFDKVADRFASRPFGNLTDRWRQFVSHKQEGEEIWSFSSPPESFSRMGGCAGFAIVSGEVIREVFVTLRT